MTSSAPFDLGTLVTCTPGVYGGRPCLAGTRYPILQVAVHYREGMSPEELAGRYSLPLDRVYAGIAYYLSNRAALDAELEADDREYDALLAAHLAERERASRASA